MACIKSAQRTALTALAPEAPYIAAGTMSSAVDMQFSASANIEIFSLDFQSDSPDLPLLAAAPSPDRFNRLCWSRPGAADGDSFSLGLLACGLSDGSVAVWNPLSMISSEGQAEDVMVTQLEKHSGPVTGLEFSELTLNRVASGGNEPNVFPPLKRIAEEMQKQVAAACAIQPKEENDLDFGCIMAANRGRQTGDRAGGEDAEEERVEHAGDMCGPEGGLLMGVVGGS
ncbi:protein transport protein SEC31B [Hordeum vulgare]|nr:protein transport protein SEC31B [Hordeum vulgare]